MESPVEKLRLELEDLVSQVGVDTDQDYCVISQVELKELVSEAQSATEEKLAGDEARFLLLEFVRACLKECRDIWCFMMSVDHCPASGRSPAASCACAMHHSGRAHLALTTGGRKDRGELIPNGS